MSCLSRPLPPRRIIRWRSVDWILIRALCFLPGLAVAGVRAEPAPALESAKVISRQLPCQAEFFSISDRPAFLLQPTVKSAAGPTPWVWYAPTFPMHPDASHLWMFRQFLAQGIAIAGVDAGESCGNPQGRAVFSALWAKLRRERGLADRACLMPQSRGGLMLYNWAAENPERVACIAGIYTVCDLRSYPGLANACAAYGMDEATLAAHLAEHNPIDRLTPLANAGVPILHIHGDSDTVVPLEKNSGELARRYHALGGSMRLIVVPGKGHQVAPEFFENQELVDFVLASAKASVRASDTRPAGTRPAATKPADASKNLIFAYFTQNGQDGLRLAYSRDGLTFRPLKGGQPFLSPQVGRERLVRDPCIVEGPDGQFHMTWTSGWWEKGFGLAHSRDLITWSAQQQVPVMEHEPTALNCWAPEIIYDDESARYVLYWSTTIPGRFPDPPEPGDKSADGALLNHRIYYTTTRDFKAFAPAKLLYDGGFNVIDATIVRDGKRWLMFLKDETLTPVHKQIHFAVSEHATGPYTNLSKPITPPWAEGPAVVRLGSAWYLYFDQYARDHFALMRSGDLEHWENLTESLRIPAHARHACILPVDERVLVRLRAEPQ